ncbi:MAG: hypothetical protein FWG85_01710 [Bacteroidetes bacterium]|nr:hypothetical protein [Bacteroidota bacterium]
MKGARKRKFKYKGILIKNVALLLVSIALASNIYAKVLPKAALPHATNPCGGGMTAKQLLQMSGMHEREFCDCFPCLCCECGDSVYVNEQNCDNCPSQDTVRKICCPGTPKEQIVWWLCCDPKGEPPCDCCDSIPNEPCDLNDCQLPRQRVVFYLHMNYSVPDFSVKLKEFSAIIKRYGGKTCCEEFLDQNGIPGNCANGYEGRINACVDPAYITNIVNESHAIGFDQETNGQVGINGNHCWCLSK